MDRELGKDAWIEQIGKQLLIVGRSMDFFLQLCPGGVEIGGRQIGARPAATRFAAAKHPLLQLLGKPSRRLPQPAFKEFHHRLRKG